MSGFMSVYVCSAETDGELASLSKQELKTKTNVQDQLFVFPPLG